MGNPYFSSDSTALCEQGKVLGMFVFSERWWCQGEVEEILSCNATAFPGHADIVRDGEIGSLFFRLVPSGVR